MATSEVVVTRRVEKVSFRERGQIYSGPVIDTDVHHTWPSQEAVIQYMSREWQDYVRSPGQDGLLPFGGNSGFFHPHGFKRDDSFPVIDGKRQKAGSNYELMCDQLLDPFRVRKALLTYDEALFALPAIANPHFASELARAMNDYTIEHWLDRDERLAGSLIFPTQHPQRAVEEIKRVGGHRQMAQVITAGSGLGPPLGHPVFHPIYKAACEAGLPLCVHVGGSGGNNYGAGGGALNYYIEFHALGMQNMITHVASFLVNGVFELFPQLKVVFLEGGVAWLPTLLWQLDDSYKRSWRELPKMKRLPSEYVADHVRLSTQPFELSPKREQMIKMMRLMRGDKVLVFSSDYPHWDTDDVDYIAKKLPREWLAKIYHENACEFYGWPVEIAGELAQERSASFPNQPPADPVAPVEPFGDIL